MKIGVLIPAVVFALFAAAGAQAASPVIDLSPGVDADVEPNRLTGSTKGRSRSSGSPPVQFMPLNPYLSLAPSDPLPAPRREDSGPGFLNIDPFDPNSVVNRVDRSFYWNPYPYHPRFNPYGQGSSPYAPGGGGNVPMGNGIPWGAQ